MRYINGHTSHQQIDDFEITVLDAFGKMISNEYKQQFVGEYTKKIHIVSKYGSLMNCD